MTTDDELRALIALGAKATARPWHGDRYDGTVKYGIKGGSDDKYVILFNDDAEPYQFTDDLGYNDEEYVLAAANLAPAIAAELLEVREAQRWIPVSERLPEESAWLLVSDAGAVNCMFFNKDTQSFEDWVDQQNPNVLTVTHWQLIIPPQEGDL